MGIGVPFFEAVSGTGNTIYALILETGVLIVYTFSIWFFASYIGTHVALVWTSEITYGLLIGIVSYFYIRYSAWHKKRI